MKLVRFGDPAQERPGVLLDDGTRVDASGVRRRLRRSVLRRRRPARARGVAGRDGASAPRVDPTVAPRPADRAAEQDRLHRPELPRSRRRKRHGPAGRAGDLLQGDDGARRARTTVVIPRGGTKLDWEVELAVVIGRTARIRRRRRTALEHVAGYALHNDYSERAFQLERGGQWVKGKSADTFAPLGPFLATRDEIPRSAGARACG